MRESALFEMTTSFSTSASSARSERPPRCRWTRSFIRSETWALPGEHLLERRVQLALRHLGHEAEAAHVDAEDGDGPAAEQRRGVDERAVAAEDHDEVGGRAPSPPRR